MIISDYHIHSSFSGDSQEDLDKIFQRAIELGLKEVAITDHHDFDYLVEDNDFALDIPHYLDTLYSYKEKYKGKLDIKVGIEVGLQPHLLDDPTLLEILHSDKFDFIIGSSHCVNKIDVAFPEIFEGHTRDELHRIYFKEMLKNVEGVDGISTYGHLDFIRRYGRAVYENHDTIDYSIHEETIKKILLKLIEKNIGVEVNTAAIRYKLDEPHPGSFILKMYKELGGEIITIGSDSHRASDLTKDFELAKEFLISHGFNGYYTFSKKVGKKILF